MITDRKLPDNSYAWPSWSSPTFFRAEVVTASDYEPFGGALENRTWTRAGGEKYRYGFNGKETSDEIASGDYDFGARIYSAPLGRWMSVDPLAGKYPNMSPYVGIGNNPLMFVDPDGRDNVIYIAVLPGVDKVLVTSAARVANVFFMQLGLHTRIMVLKDANKPIILDATDALHVVGLTFKHTKSYILTTQIKLYDTYEKNNPDGIAWPSNEGKTAREAANHPEESGNRVSMIQTLGLEIFAKESAAQSWKDKAEGNAKVAKTLALIFLHAAGHNAKAEHTEANYDIMESGIALRGILKSYNGDIDKLVLNTKSNKVVIGKLVTRFQPRNQKAKTNPSNAKNVD